MHSDGRRDQAAGGRAQQLVHKDGAPVRELRKLAAGPPERCDLTWLCRNAEAVLEGRDVVVHAIPLEDITAGAECGLLGWHPRTGEEIWLTALAVLGHVEDFGIVWHRLDEAIAASTAQTGARRVIRRPAVFGGPPWGPAAEAGSSAVSPPGTACWAEAVAGAWGGW